MPGPGEELLSLLKGDSALPGDALRPVAPAPAEEGVPLDLAVAVAELPVACFEVADERPVVGQNQNAFPWEELAQQVRPVDDDQRLTAARHTIDQTNAKLPGHCMGILRQIQVCLEHLLLPVVEQITGQLGAGTPLIGSRTVNVAGMTTSG